VTPRARLHGALLALCTSLTACTHWSHSSLPSDSTYREEVSAGLEEIYVTRTTRTQYIQGATPACSVAPFSTTSEQHYDTWSLQVRASDARIVRTHDRRVGEFMACFGPVSPGGTFPAYAHGAAGSLIYSAVGDCRFMRSKPPAPGLLVLACTLDLSELPSEYIGGYMTTSSLAPSGGVHVRGYLSTSVITMRLWKKPVSAGG
jgi:hypothetical protein